MGFQRTSWGYFLKRTAPNLKQMHSRNVIHHPKVAGVRVLCCASAILSFCDLASNYNLRRDEGVVVYVSLRGVGFRRLSCTHSEMRKPTPLGERQVDEAYPRYLNIRYHGRRCCLCLPA